VPSCTQRTTKGRACFQSPSTATTQASGRNQPRQLHTGCTYRTAANPGHLVANPPPSDENPVDVAGGRSQRLCQGGGRLACGPSRIACKSWACTAANRAAAVVFGGDLKRCDVGCGGGCRIGRSRPAGIDPGRAARRNLVTCPPLAENRDGATAGVPRCSSMPRRQKTMTASSHPTAERSRVSRQRVPRAASHTLAKRSSAGSGAATRRLVGGDLRPGCGGVRPRRRLLTAGEAAIKVSHLRIGGATLSRCRPLAPVIS